jgi:ankyrin repeat protein
MKFAFYHVARDQFAPGNSVLNVSFFFHGRGVDLQRTRLGLFRSVLYQILHHDPSTLSTLVQAFEKKQKMGKPGEECDWQESELLGFLEASLPVALESYSIRIFVDAPDECGEDTAVGLVETFQTLISKVPQTSSNFSICFACRHYPILNTGRGLEVCVDHENGKDISKFVQSKLQSYQLGDGKLGDLIIDKASGVFQWASLVVDSVSKLNRKGYGINKIVAEIQRIPQNLDELYRSLLDSIPEEDKRQSLKLVQWICFAMRPLTLDELRYALVLDANCPYKSLRECQGAEEYIDGNDAIERRVTDLSCGLAETLVSRHERTVQFIHQSVKDFFVQGGIRILDSKVTAIDLAIGKAHYQLSRSCIRYIAMEEIGHYTAMEKDQSRSFNELESELNSKFPFINCAVKSWAIHAEQAEAKNIRQVDLLGLLTQPANVFFERWISLYSQIDWYSADCPPKGTTFLHTASRYGLTSVLSADPKELFDSAMQIHSLDDVGWTPLFYAAVRGHGIVVKVLLENNADPDWKDYYGLTPLLYAAAKGHQLVVKELLAGGADPDSKDRNGWTPLLYAADGGHEAVVELLVQKKININAQDNIGATALHWVAWRGYGEVMALLLKNAADIETKAIGGGTPLAWAIEAEFKTGIKILLTKGCNVTYWYIVVRALKFHPFIIWIADLLWLL